MAAIHALMAQKATASAKTRPQFKRLSMPANGKAAARFN
jgi:hypothetical protein